jgi:hypothetical protein
MTVCSVLPLASIRLRPPGVLTQIEPAPAARLAIPAGRLRSVGTAVFALGSTRTRAAVVLGAWNSPPKLLRVNSVRNDDASLLVAEALAA